MSDPSDELKICPHCGQQNSVFSLICINCGQELDDIFEIEGLENSPTESLDEQSLETVLNALDENPLLTQKEDPQENDSDKEADDLEEQPNAGEEIPSWLDKVRQRAKEEDPAGDFAKASKAADEKRGEVDEAFDQVLRRIRESEQNKAGRTPKLKSGLVDENGDPEWLRRIRELHPDQEEYLENESAEADDEWTEEELAELFRKELGLPDPNEQLDEAPEEILAEQENYEGSQVEAEAEAEVVPADFHNIPEEASPSSWILVTNEESEPSEETQKTASAQKDIESNEGVVVTEEAEDDESLAEAVEPHLIDDSELDDAVDSPLTNNEEAEASDDEEEPQPEIYAFEKEEIDESPLPTEDIAPNLLLLRDQRDRARILNEVIGQEGRRSIPLLHEGKRKNQIGHIVLSLMLILGILATILFTPKGYPTFPESETALAFAENLNMLPDGQSVLLVLDYQAGSRNEIEPLLEKTLEVLNAKSSKLRVVTANPENLWLSPTVIEGSAKEIEFIPGGVIGYLTLAVAEKPDWDSLPIDKAINTKADIFDGVGQVILVSDSSEFIRSWIEQVSSFHPELNTSAITSSVSAPMLSPYAASGQIKGYVAGMNDAKTLGVENDLLVNQRAFQVGTLLMIVVLILGVIMKLDEDAQLKSERSDG